MESTRKRSPLSPPQSPHLSSNSSSPTSRRQPTRVIAESSNYDKLATINDLALSEFSSGSSALGVGRRYDTVGGAGEDDYEPGGDSANATIVEARRREKGKGRMRVVPEGEEVEPTSSSTRERSNGSESPAYDEAEQERRVTEVGLPFVAVRIYLRYTASLTREFPAEPRPVVSSREEAQTNDQTF